MSRKHENKAVRIDIEDGAAEVPSDADEAQAQSSEEELVAAAIAAGEAAADADFKAERDSLAERVAELEEKLARADEAAIDAADQKLRIQADWDNFRRRTAAERLAERQLATEKLVSNLLPVIDDMERAIAHATDAAAGDDNLQQFSDGVAAVRAKMLDILAHEGVEMIDPAGEPFDPLAHQAVGRVEDKETFDETVAEVYQKGYRMADKVIRPAMVTVAFGGPARPVEPEDQSADEEAAE